MHTANTTVITHLNFIFLSINLSLINKLFFIHCFISATIRHLHGQPAAFAFRTQRRFFQPASPNSAIRSKEHKPAIHVCFERLHPRTAVCRNATQHANFLTIEAVFQRTTGTTVSTANAYDSPKSRIWAENQPSAYSPPTYPREDSI